MRVKRFAQLLLAVQVVMVVALGLSVFRLEHQLELLNRSRDVAFNSYLLAEELRQSSDDLTRLSRSFVATGDPEFEREYWAVLGIRNGKLPRPAESRRGYRDLAKASNPRSRPSDKAVPLRQLMVAEGFTPAELAKLDEAQTYSDALAHAEVAAMNAAQGLFDDGGGNFMLQRAPDRELATRLLHDEAYREAKRRIMQPLGEFYAMFEARTAGAVSEFLAGSRAQLQWLSVLLMATLALFIGSFAALRRQSAERQAAQVALAESEARYRTIFQTAADGFGLADKSGRLLEVNAALCRISGYSAEELRSMRISDLEAAENMAGISQHLEHARTHQDDRFSARLKHRNGSTLDVEISAQYRDIDSGRFVMILRDLTETERAQRELEELVRVETLMADLAASFVNAADDALDEVVHDAIKRICAGFDLDIASIWQPEYGAPERVVRTHAVFLGESPRISSSTALTDHPWLLDLSRTNKTVTIADPASLPTLTPEDRERLLARGVTNLVSIPWCTAPDRLDGAVYFASTRGRQPDAAAVGRLETLARTILVALSRARERRAVSEARERMRTLLEMLDDAPAGITIHSQNVFLYANKQAVAMHGYTPEEFAERTLLELVAPEEKSRLESIRRVILEQGSLAFNVWHQRKDGSRLHLGAQARRGTWLGNEANITVFVDLSESEKAAHALHQSEERYRLVTENISDVIAVVDVETRRFEYVSPSVLRLRGYTAEEAMGQPFESTLTAESHVRARYRLEELLEAEAAGLEQAALAEDHAVYHQTRKGGGTVPTEVRSRILRDPTNGKPLLLSVARDISERRKSQEEREDLQQQLYQSQKMEAVGSLAGGIAHDFNNLLSVIMSYTDFVVDKLPEDDQRRSDLIEVQKASERAVGLVRQLLAFSRKQILEPRVIDLNQIVSGVEKMLQRLLGEDIRLEVALADKLGSVLADAGQVEQVLMNLVVNARDAMPLGGRLTLETANVEVTEHGEPASAKLKPGRYTAFTVADSGSGMDAATLARAFEPFFTTKGIGKGTGLGLSTVYGIVKQSEGEVEVRSKLGEGTAITVYLPRQDAPLSARPRPPVARPNTGHETVLVVEDEDGLRALVERILRNAGYQVLVAENGADALALFYQHQGKVDLLLTDVVMPQMSGRELAELLAEAKPTLKVLYMSGYTDEIIDRYGVLNDGVRLIGKPFTAADMNRKVRTMLDEEAGI